MKEGSNKILISSIELNYDYNKDNMKTTKNLKIRWNFFNSSHIKVGCTFKSHTCDLYLCERDRERERCNELCVLNNFSKILTIHSNQVHKTLIFVE